MSFGDWRETKQKISMSERVGKLDEFQLLRETACVHIEERTLIGYCRAYAKLYPQDTEFIKDIQEKGIPALIEIGRGKWYRDTITDLGLALSGTQSESKSEDAEKILDADIE